MCQHAGVPAGGEEEEPGGAQEASEETAAGGGRRAGGRAPSRRPGQERHLQAAAAATTAESRGSAISPRGAQEDGDSANMFQFPVQYLCLNLNYCGVFFSAGCRGASEGTLEEEQSRPAQGE